MKLRTLVRINTGLLAALGLALSVTLITTTSVLRYGADEMGSALESVRAAEELGIRLLIHDREHRLALATRSAEHERLREEAAGQLQQWLARSARYVGPPPEGELLEDVRQRIGAYLHASTSADAGAREQRLEAALDAAQRLVTLNLDQARGTQRQADRVDRLANRVGVAAVVLLLAGLLAIGLIGKRVYGPLVRIRQGLAQFKAGDKHHRLRETGPVELGEIAAEFNAMADTLAEREQAQLTFLAGVAHDLRTPLQALKLTAAAGARGSTPLDGEKLGQLLARISRQVEHLNRMVEDLLDRTRIEAGALELRLAECDLRKLATDVVELHRAVSQEHRLELQVPERPVPLRCDSTRLSQVLTNLVSNALKYSPAGGVVRIVVEATATEALVAVSDEGIGISPEDLERIFHPFQRAKGSKDAIPGVGLGLSVARRIVQAHGGTIEVESRPGAGSTFGVRLPLLAA
ncbi:MAG TPA: ATP-binding protein [Myxococcaceae bacterium]|nr:ATP-binding protein [Myxococcaceae bacterium]